MISMSWYSFSGSSFVAIALNLATRPCALLPWADEAVEEEDAEVLDDAVEPYGEPLTALPNPPIAGGGWLCMSPLPFF